MTERTFHFVPHHRVAAFQAKGWRIIHTMAEYHHGDHAVLMELVT